MVVNLNTAIIYCGVAVIYHGIFPLENGGSAEKYCSIFIWLAPGLS
jgi:hypothetical protein